MNQGQRCSHRAAQTTQARVPCGVVSALAEPSSWCTGVVLAVAGVVLRFLLPPPLHVQVVHHMPHHVSVCARPNRSTPPRVVLVVHHLPLHAAMCAAQLLHLCAWCMWAVRAPSWFPWVACTPLWLTRVAFAPVRWPQRPSEQSDTQHAKGRTGDCPGPRTETATRRNVRWGGGGLSGGAVSRAPPFGGRSGFSQRGSRAAPSLQSNVRGGTVWAEPPERRPCQTSCPIGASGTGSCGGACPTSLRLLSLPHPTHTHTHTREAQGVKGGNCQECGDGGGWGWGSHRGPAYRRPQDNVIFVLPNVFVMSPGTQFARC